MPILRNTQHSDLPYHSQESIVGQPQAKVCSSCQQTLVDPTTAFQDTHVVCTFCRGSPSPLAPPQEQRQHRIDQDTSYPVRQSSHEVPVLPNTRRIHDPPPAPEPYHTYPTTKKTPLLSIQCTNIPPTHRHQQQQQQQTTHFPVVLSYGDLNSAPRHTQHATTASFSPDPLADITRLRVRTRAHHCLYPGATFEGTQKSGRNSYDVNVTIVVRRLLLALVGE